MCKMQHLFDCFECAFGDALVCCFFIGAFDGFFLVFVYLLFSALDSFEGERQGKMF